MLRCHNLLYTTDGRSMTFGFDVLRSQEALQWVKVSVKSSVCMQAMFHSCHGEVPIHMPMSVHDTMCVRNLYHIIFIV